MLLLWGIQSIKMSFGETAGEGEKEAATFKSG